MKKITLLCLAIVAGFSVQAQEFSIVSTSSSSSTTLNNPQAVVWDQPSIGGSGIISDYSVPDDVGVYSADDFELLEDTRITSISVYGFQNLANLPTVLSGLALYIYNNSGSNTPDGDPTQPGTGVVEFDNIDTLPIPGYPVTIVEDGGNYTLIVDMYLANGDADVILPAGNYWLAVAPRINVSPVSDGDQRWNWFDAGVPANGVNEAHLIDPTDVFGAGATSWTAFSALGLSFGSTAFTIEGEPALGVGDNLAELSSVYPNPTSTVLNVKLPSTAEVLKSNLYNVLGQDMGLKLVNGTMNTSSLENGVYILNVETTQGTLTQKVVKQ